MYPTDDTLFLGVSQSILFYIYSQRYLLGVCKDNRDINW